MSPVGPISPPAIAGALGATDPLAPSAPFDRALETTMRRAAPTELAPRRTQMSGGDAAQALRTAWTRLFGRPPTEDTVAVLTAQWAHETGGGRAMQNFNFGGIKGVGPSGLSAAYLTHEGSGAARRTEVDHFRAYGSAAEGATDYVALLRNRFPTALEAAGRGDAAAFVHELKRSGYFTDSETTYARSVGSLALRAKTAGYDALGAGPTSIAAQTPVAQHAGASAATPSAARFIDVTAMTDEIARAALRIAAGPPRGEES